MPRGQNEKHHRPVILNYRAVPEFVSDMLSWRKMSEPDFSVRRGCAGLRRCSPALVTLVCQGKRKLSPDRIEDFATLLKLSSDERKVFNDWILVAGGRPSKALPTASGRKRLRQNDLLRSWLNVYVKDTARLKGFRPDPETIHRLLGGLASTKQIARSLAFLLEHGYLRRTLDGRVVEHSPLVYTTDEQRDRGIRKFHLKSLDVTKRALKIHPMEATQSSASVLALNHASFLELKELLKEFYEKLTLFAEAHDQENERLYQVVLHLHPVGGSA